MITDTDRDCAARGGCLALLCVVVVMVVLTVLNVLCGVNQSGWLPRGDMGNLSAMVVSAEHPEAFARDVVFSDPDRFDFYIPAFIAVLKFFYRLTGDFDFFVKFSSALILPVQMLGFYLLGMTLTRNRWASLALILLSICYVTAPRGEFIGWRGFQLMLPRTFFLALLPYPFYLAFRFSHRYAAWCLAMLLIGLLSYVHPVSAPAMAAGLWFIHLAYHPRHWSPARHVLAAILLALTFLVVLLPFGLWYKTHVQIGNALPPGFTRDQAVALIDARVPGAFDTVGTFLQTARFWTSLPLLPILLLALAGLLTGLLAHPTRRTTVAILLWLLGIWVASFLVPLIEWRLSILTGTLPSQISIVRSMRYFSVPLFLLAVLSPVAVMHMSGRLKPSASKFLTLVVSLCVALGVLWLFYSAPPMANLARRTIDGLRHFRLVAKTPSREKALVQSLEFIRDKTPVGALFMSNNSGAASAIRSVSLRPLAHCRKDGALLIYSDLAALKLCMEKETSWVEAQGKVNAEGIEPLVHAARTLGAEYLLIERPRDAQSRAALNAPPTEVLLQNYYWLVLKLPAD